MAPVVAFRLIWNRKFPAELFAPRLRMDIARKIAVSFLPPALFQSSSTITWETF